MENVKGFKNHDKGNTFATVKLTLEQLGYRVYADVLNAKNFGVPQNRERIYIVAIRNDFNPTFNLDFDKLKNTKVNCQVGDILQNQVDEKYTISDKLWAEHHAEKQSILRKVMVLATHCLTRNRLIPVPLAHVITKMVQKF